MLNIRKLMWIVLGSIWMAIGIHFFLMPHLILDGGLIGVALMLNYLGGFRVGFMMLCSSILLFICLFHWHRQMVTRSFLAMIISTWIIDLFAPLQYVFSYYVSLSAFTSSWIGGICLGIGFGLMLRSEITTGGTDLIAYLISKRIACNAGYILVIIDIAIIALGGLFISIETFMYSLITVCVGGLTTSLWVRDKAS
jgi:uncharacterized membrane-anchored protein YitT (DUF2179 family)